MAKMESRDKMGSRNQLTELIVAKILNKIYDWFVFVYCTHVRKYFFPHELADVLCTASLYKDIALFF